MYQTKASASDWISVYLTTTSEQPSLLICDRKAHRVRSERQDLPRPFTDWISFLFHWNISSAGRSVVLVLIQAVVMVIIIALVVAVVVMLSMAGSSSAPSLIGSVRCIRKLFLC